MKEVRFTYRVNPMPKMDKHLTPMKAIRLKCLECSNGSATEVRLCPCTNCPLYELRSGHIPWRKRNTENSGADEAFMNEPVEDDNFIEDEDEDES